MSDRSFPIMRPIYLREQQALAAAGVTMIDSVPWSLLAPHERQAVRNHDQSLQMLAERGGLSACEALAVLEDRPWRQMPDAVAYKALADKVRGNSQ